MFDGETNPISSDDLSLTLFVVEQHGIHILRALSLKNQRLCLPQQLIGCHKR